MIFEHSTMYIYSNMCPTMDLSESRPNQSTGVGPKFPPFPNTPQNTIMVVQ